MKFRNSYSAYHVAVCEDGLPDEIKDMEIAGDCKTTYEIADPTLKFVCGNCRMARYKKEHIDKGEKTKIYCCVYKNKSITPLTPACIDLKSEISVFNNSFNPVGKGGYSSGYDYNDKEDYIGKRLVE